MGLDRIECVVIGAGVVGLAVARAMAMAGREVLIVETAGMIGSETSARNSEVIHAGIYYPADSLKARTCVEGKHRLYAFCLSRGIAHSRCGKLIVATSEAQLDDLADIVDRAEANGVRDLEVIDPEQAYRMEPRLACHGAIHSPSTGIIDSHGFMLALQGEAEDHGATIAIRTRLERAEIAAEGIKLHFSGGEPFSLLAGFLVNAAGLDAVTVARRIEGLDPAHVPDRRLAKGNYFRLAGKAPFDRLIYPVPEPGGLGTHVTIDLGGQARFGPDVEWIDTVDYSVDPARGDKFYAEVRKYFPDLPDGSLSPDYCGIRPKIERNGIPVTDFIVSGPGDHGVDGLVNLFGIESPGLTAALALAEEVKSCLRG